jgi:hypothetical protein
MMPLKRLPGTALCFVLVVAWGTPPALAPAEYIVTLDPIKIDSAPGGICVAIDPADPAGVWWWGPGRSGCTTRNTMAQPHQENVTGLAALFHPVDAVVSHTQAIRRMGKLSEERVSVRYDDFDNPLEEVRSDASREMRMDDGVVKTEDKPPHVQHVRFRYRYDSSGNWTERVVSQRLEPIADTQPSNIERRTITYYTE